MKGFIYVFLLIGLLVGCSASTEEIKKETKTAVEQAFKSKPTETNKKSDAFSYYLPSDMEVQKEESNNVIIEKGKEDLYILFLNPNEAKNSQVMFETVTPPDNSKEVVSETFKDKERFGYVKVFQTQDEKLYEVSVGIGGVKMTSEAKANTVAEVAGEMMKIVSSVK